ncbi:TetR family transcriptional regulator [Pseudomonas sp. IT-P294]
MHQQWLQRLGMDEPGRVTADAFELVEDTLDQAGAMAGGTLSHRDEATHKGGAMLLFHHF